MLKVCSVAGFLVQSANDTLLGPGHRIKISTDFAGTEVVITPCYMRSKLCLLHEVITISSQNKTKPRMWANAQRDGRPAKHRWRPSLQRRKVWLTPTT